MRLRIFRLSCLILYSISFLIAVALFILSIMYAASSTDFYMTPIACGVETLLTLAFVVLSIKNFNKETCALVDLAYEKDMRINRAAFIGSIVIIIIGIACLIGGILLVSLTKQFALGFALLALSNFIIFNIILYYIYMYVEIHY